jgi:hypothetical protein
MTYQIDQSGKIEQTNRQTIVALANGKILTVRISSIEKQKLIKTMLELDRPFKNYTHKIFAALIFILLSKQKLTEVLIDTEYSGHDANIKEILIQLFQKNKQTCPEINFGYVGKKSNAHLVGIDIFRNNRKADIIITGEDILKLFYEKSKEKGWRPRSSRGNP